MAITLHGSIQSTCTQRVLFTLYELDVQFSLVEVSMQKGEHKDPKYVNGHHPFGRLPALEDGETKLFESRAICQYLIAKYGKGSVFDVGSQPPERIGAFEQAASVDYSYFDPSMKDLAFQKIFKEMMGLGAADSHVVDQLTAVLRTTLDYYEKILSSHEYLSGDSFTVIDVYTVPWVRFLPLLGLQDELDSRPNFKAWWERVSGRESWKKVVKQLEGE